MQKKAFSTPRSNCGSLPAPLRTEERCMALRGYENWRPLLRAVVRTWADAVDVLRTCAALPHILLVRSVDRIVDIPQKVFLRVSKYYQAKQP